MRAAEKGYRVGVMESGRRWKDEDIPKTQWDLAHFIWLPAAELYGVQRIEYLDHVTMISQPDAVAYLILTAVAATRCETVAA